MRGGHVRPGSDGFDLIRMREFLDAKGVARQYWPERLEVVPELPRTPSGKIRKFEIRDQLAR